MNQSSTPSSVVSVMQQVADLTSRREKHELQSGLLSLMAGVLRAQEATLLAVKQEHGQCYVKLLCQYSASAQPPVYVAEHQNWQPATVSKLQVLAQMKTLDGPFEKDGHVWLAIRQLDEIVALIKVRCAHLSEHDKDFLLGLTRIHENYLQLLHEAERDMLTGLLNRRKFDTRLYELIDRRAPGYILALLDIDHFKRINDGYGHIVGDEVLLLVAGLMNAELGEVAQLYRYGGEEFALVLALSEPDALAKLEHFRQVIEQYAFPQVGQITVSIGYVPILAQSLPAHAIEEADKALYHAKQHGRNQVQSYEALAASGHVSTTQTGGDIELF